MKHPFQPRNAALLVALAAIYPMVAHSAAGIAQFTAGDVNVRRGTAATPLAKGQRIESGDSIVTGAAGQAQLRFSDGGLVSLAPNTQFNITNYADADDPAKDSFAVNLFRGGMRAITGLIGKRNRENYKVTTNTATIGIRGSAFSAAIDPATGTLTVAGEQDAIQVCTQAGCVELTVGEIVRINNNGEVPARTALNTNLPPLSRLEQTGATKGQPEFEIPATGINGAVAGVSAMFTSNDEFPYNGFLVGGADPSIGIGTFANSLLTRHFSTDNSLPSTPGETLTFEQLGSGSSSFGVIGTANDEALVGWGYWEAARLTIEGNQALPSGNSGVYDLAGVHYLVGRPTPLLQMPASGNANFSLVGGTNPTATLGYGGNSTIVGELVGAGLNVNFTTGILQAHVNTRFVLNSQTINVQIGDYGYINGNQFYSNDDDGALGYFQGFFTGAGATRAGMIYYGYDDDLGYITGAAGFVRTGSSADITNLYALYIDQDDDAPLGPVGGYTLLNGNQLVLQADEGNFDPYCYCGGSNTVMSATTPVTSVGAAGAPTDADFIGWGYWAKGTGYVDYSGTSLTGVHYIVGRPTTNMPIDGTATYSMIGGTAPTATYGGVSILGTLLSASLQVDFGSGNLQANVATQFTKNNVTSTVTLVENATINGAFFSGGGNCGGNVRGLFVGNAASRAGMVYQQTANHFGNNGSNPSNLGVVRGSVALQRGAITLPD